VVARRRAAITAHEELRRKFEAKGFATPDVLFWNVSMSKASVSVVAA
jgi:hypothetical protein